VKESESLPVPLEDGLVTMVSLPKFVRRPYEVRVSRLVARDNAGHIRVAETELGSDVADLAFRDLDARRGLVLAKAVARPALKYLVEKNQKAVLAKRQGEATADVFGFLASLYNIFTEQPDLRSWQSLPAQVRVARMDLSPGEYTLRLEDLGDGQALLAAEDRGLVKLAAGQSYFFIRRTVR
jgi:hypothetical protein